jgi:hypothetical protein
MADDIKRFAALLSKIGTDAALPGLRELFAALSEERARRFVSWLTEGEPAKSSNAAAVLNKLVQRQGGEKILRHVVREIFFGTETISLATLALLASNAAREPSTTFFARAARGIDGLSNEDAIVFLLLLGKSDGISVLREWRPACFLNLAEVRSERWAQASALAGIDEHVVIASLEELTRRRFFLPDTAKSRLGGGGVSLYFGFFEDSLRYYALLSRGLEIAEPLLCRELGLATLEQAETTWRKLTVD